MGWLKKAFKKVNNIARKIDPIGHKVVDKVVAQDSRNVRSLAKLFGGSATGKGLASSLYREADRNVQDPQWALAKAAIATATAYGGMAAYGALSGAGGAAAGAGGSTVSGLGSYGSTAGALGGDYFGSGIMMGAAPSAVDAGVTYGVGGLGGSSVLSAGGAYGGAGLGQAGGITGLMGYGEGGIGATGTLGSAPSTFGQTSDALSNANRLRQLGNQLTGGNSGGGGANVGLGGGTSSSGNNMLDSAGGLGGNLGYAPRQEQAWLDQYNQTQNPVQQKLALQKDMKLNPDDWGVDTA